MSEETSPRLFVCGCTYNHYHCPPSTQPSSCPLFNFLVARWDWKHENADMPPSLNGHYYHLACPLCWQDVDRSQTDSFRLLPLNPEKISWFYEKPIFEEQWYSLVKVGGRTITHPADHPDEPGLYKTMGLTYEVHQSCQPSATVKAISAARSSWTNFSLKADFHSD